MKRSSAADLDVRSQLEDRLHRYCWGFDERREDVLLDCFTAAASWTGNVMGETQIGPHVGRETVVGWLAGFWPHQRDQRRHVVTNFMIDTLTAREATAYAYLLLVGSSRRTVALEAAGFYRIDFRRELGARREERAWRISALVAGFDIPFWRGEVEDMEPWVRDLFGVTTHVPAPPASSPEAVDGPIDET